MQSNACCRLTLLVHPAASLPNVAKESGASLAIINLSKTPCDNVCDILIKEKAGLTIDAIVKGVRQKMLKTS